MSKQTGGSLTWLACAALASCTPPPPVVIPPAPPKAFLSIPKTTVVAPTIKGSVITMGCKKVGQLQILEANNFLMDARYSGEPTNFEIPPSLFNTLYPKRGFATSLSLSAKVVCEETNALQDGGFSVREGVSQALAITFLPVQSVRTDPQGLQTMPDSFVAEGGIGGQPTTFIGCEGTATGSGLVRLDQNGNRLAMNQALPFECDYSSAITDRNTASGTRWMWVPQKGAAAFDGNLNITAAYMAPVSRLSVSPLDGDAIITISDPSSGVLREAIRLRARPAQGQQTKMWSTLRQPNPTGYPGDFAADPVVDPGTQRVFTASWQYSMVTGRGLIAILIYNYNNGDLVVDPPTAILNFDFGEPINRPIPPTGAFKEDGTLFYAPLLTVDRQSGQFRTTVLACATNAPGCGGAARQWMSPTFDGDFTTLFTFSRGNFIGVVSPFASFFLGASDGQVKNLGGTEPLRPTGSLVTQGIVTGKSNDLYVLNAPVPGINMPTFPTEVIVTDHPANGELWRVAIQGGTTPADSMYIAVDDNGQAWMRLGTDQVRPLALTQYRETRGATTPP